MNRDYSNLLGFSSYAKSLGEPKPLIPPKSDIVKIEPIDDDFINIALYGLDGASSRFRMKKTSCFGRLMEKYSDIVGIPKEAMRFRFDGIPITSNSSPMSMDMENDDTIEVYLQQTGGSGNNTLKTTETHQSTTKLTLPTEQQPPTSTKWRESGPITNWGIHFNREINSMERRVRRMAISKRPAQKHCRKCDQQPSSLRKSSLEERYDWLFRSPEPTTIKPKKQDPVHPFPSVHQFFNNKTLTVSIEGNIAAGKTTLINQLEKMASVFTIREPLEKWCDQKNGHSRSRSM